MARRCTRATSVFWLLDLFGEALDAEINDPCFKASLRRSVDLRRRAEEDLPVLHVAGAEGVLVTDQTLSSVLTLLVLLFLLLWAFLIDFLIHLRRKRVQLKDRRQVNRRANRKALIE